MKKCDQNIKSTFSLVDQMLKTAETGDHYREDTGCGILYGFIRDSAYKILQLAEKEKIAHINKGWWDENN